MNYDKPVKKIYIDVSVIPSTSVMAESLFSQSKYIFNDRRLSTTPEHVEEIMFLRTNHHLWDLEFVCKEIVISSSSETRNQNIDENGLV